MNTNAIKHIAHRALLALGALAFAFGAAADERTGVHMETDLYFNSGLHYQVQGSSSKVTESASLMVFTEIWSPARGLSAGLFVDYQLWTDGSHDGSIFTGGMLKYRWARWDASAVAAASIGPDGKPVWFYMNRVGFKPNPDNKVSLQVLGPMTRPENAKLMLSWGRSVSDSLHLTVAAGSSINESKDLSARVELSWHIR